MFNFEDNAQLPSGAKILQGIPFAAEKQKVEAKPIYVENSPFLLMHHRGGWIYDMDLKCVVPLFKPLIAKGGVNNSTSRGSEVDTRGAEKMFESRGFTIIKGDAEKNGGYGEYVIKHEIAVMNQTGTGLKPGVCYLTKWEQLVDYGDGVICELKINKKEFGNFINCLLDSKIIKPPRIELLQGLISKYRGHMQRNAANMHNIAVKSRYEKDLEIIENIQKQIDEMLGKKPKVEAKNGRS